MSVTFQDIRQVIQKPGLAGRVLCVHSSLRSFGPVEGGATSIVEALLAEECTILVPSFTWRSFRPETKRVYTTGTREIDKGMGAIPLAVLAEPQRVRGNHPLCSFTAVGPFAQELMIGQTPLRPLAPLEALVNFRGMVLMMGVNLDSMTLLHLAELNAGRPQQVEWASGMDGQPVQVNVNGDSACFEQFAPHLAPLERRITVGRSLWRIFPAHETLMAAQQAITQFPQIGLCNET
jgi:aminoglycoside N3'-acetyltransferase